MSQDTRNVQKKAQAIVLDTDEVSIKSAETEAAAQIRNCREPHLPRCAKTEQQPPFTISPAVAAASSSSNVYSKKIAHAVCEELAKGRTLKAVCASSKNFPKPHIVRKWAMEDIDGFAAEFAKARELGFMTMADELIEIVDQIDGNITRDKLRVDTRKWLLAKALPKGFGDTPDLKTTLNMDLGIDAYELGKKIAFALELSSRATPKKREGDEGGGD